jgi:hypothetical protein
VTQVTASPAIRRPAYREGQLLRVGELRAEQRSRADALLRHEQNVHTPGVIAGLQVTVATARGAAGIRIEPGLAIDGAGRYVGLGQPLTAPLADGEDVTVSIIWHGGTSQIELSSTPPPALAGRTSDAWPVVLGRARRSARRVALQTDVREELQLRATRLTAPAGASRVVLGGQSGRSAQVLGVQLSDGAGGFADVTTADADGTAHVSVDTSVAGPAQAAGPVVFDVPASPPAAALPWSLYRATLTRPDQTVAEQLRLEVGEVKSGVNARGLELLVMRGGTGAEQDLLHADAGANVTIPGNLVVKGFTTVAGFPGVPDAPTLSALAAQEANLLALAQVLLNQLTDTDLRAHQVGTWTASGNTVAYTLRLVSSAATDVSSIAVYETVVNLAASTLVSNQFIGRDINLPASNTHDIARTITVGPHPTPVLIAVLAVGVGQDGQPRTGTLRFQAST